MDVHINRLDQGLKGIEDLRRVDGKGMEDGMVFYLGLVVLDDDRKNRIKEGDILQNGVQ